MNYNPKKLDQTSITSNINSFKDAKQVVYQAKHVHFNDTQDNSKEEKNSRNQNKGKGSTTRNNARKPMNMAHHKPYTRNNEESIEDQKMSMSHASVTQQ